MIVKRLKFKKILVIGLIGLLPVTGAFAQDTITVSLPKSLGNSAERKPHDKSGQQRDTAC